MLGRPGQGHLTWVTYDILWMLRLGVHGVAWSLRSRTPKCKHLGSSWESEATQRAGCVTPSCWVCCLEELEGIGQGSLNPCPLSVTV